MGLFGKSKQEKAVNLVETGSRAVGTVLSVADTGVTMNDNPRVQMNFRIEPLDGSPAFEAEKTKVVSRVQIPRAGDRYPASARPNLVMGSNVQVCWEKFCNFWEVEARQVPMEGERFHLDPEAAARLCDENTIGVVAVLGSTAVLRGSVDDLQDGEALAEVAGRVVGIEEVRDETEVVGLG